MALGGHGLEGTGTAAAIIAAADLVICIGTRLTDFATGSQSCFRNPEVRFISINVCGHDAFKEGALPILADAREAMRALHQAALAAGLKPRPGYREEVDAARSRMGRERSREVCSRHEGEAMSQGELIRTLNREARAGDTVIAAAGGPPGDLLKLWDATGGRALPPRVRLLLHGLRDPGGARRPHGPARGRGLRPDRRRHLPDEPDRARHRGAGGAQDHGRRLRKPRLSVHPPAPDVADRRQLRQRVPPSRPRHQSPGRRVRPDRPGQECRELRRPYLACRRRPSSSARRCARPATNADVRHRRGGREASHAARRRGLVGRGPGRGQPGSQDPRAACGVRAGSRPTPAALIIETPRSPTTRNPRS